MRVLKLARIGFNVWQYTQAGSRGKRKKKQKLSFSKEKKKKKRLLTVDEKIKNNWIPLCHVRQFGIHLVY